MKPKRNSLAGIIMAAMALRFLAGCQSDRPTQTSWSLANEIERGVFETWLAYSKSDYSTRPEVGIPSRYWSEPIKALNPVKVYADGGNTVIVQKFLDGVEFGKYVVSLSSARVTQEADGFKLTPIAGLVYDYRRE